MWVMAVFLAAIGELTCSPAVLTLQKLPQELHLSLGRRHQQPQEHSLDLLAVAGGRTARRHPPRARTGQKHTVELIGSPSAHSPRLSRAIGATWSCRFRPASRNVRCPIPWPPTSSTSMARMAKAGEGRGRRRRPTAPRLPPSLKTSRVPHSSRAGA